MVILMVRLVPLCPVSLRPVIQLPRRRRDTTVISCQESSIDIYKKDLTILVQTLPRDGVTHFFGFGGSKSIIDETNIILKNIFLLRIFFYCYLDDLIVRRPCSAE